MRPSEAKVWAWRHLLMRPYQNHCGVCGTIGSSGIDAGYASVCFSCYIGSHKRFSAMIECPICARGNERIHIL